MYLPSFEPTFIELNAVLFLQDLNSWTPLSEPKWISKLSKMRTIDVRDQSTSMYTQV